MKGFKNATQITLNVSHVYSGELIDFFNLKERQSGKTYEITIDGETDDCYKGKYLIKFID